jgi:hypothetical protein
MKQKQINFRPSQQALKNLHDIQTISGANQTSAIEMSVAFFSNTLKKGDFEMENIDFVVYTDLEHYGFGATEETLTEYVKFAKAYLHSRGYGTVNIIYEANDMREHDDQHNIRLDTWTAFCNS